MKRREFLKLIASGVAWSLFPLNTSANNKTANPYHILLISDLHLPWRSKKFPEHKEGEKIFAQKEEMLKHVKSWGNVNEAALLGDFPARYGNEEEFLSVDKFVDEINKITPSYIAIGNHDYAYRGKTKGKLEHGTLEEKLAKLNMFKERYKMPSLYYARNVGDYRLVYLAPDACGKYLLELSSTQLEWLKKEIADHQHAPMIFFFHAPLMGTLKKYHKNINTPSTTAQPEDALAEILKNAPKGSLWVSGHTHTSANNESFANDDINRFNESIVNIHNPTIDGKNLWTNSLFLYEDRIIVRTFDHKKNVWLNILDRVYFRK